MTNGDPKAGFFYPTLTKTVDFFLAYRCVYFFYLFIYSNKLPEVSECAKMHFHMMTLLDVLGKIAWVR